MLSFQADLVVYRFQGVRSLPLVILLFALFASLFTLSKTALNYSEPFFLIGSRMFIAGVVLLAHQYLFNRAQFKVKTKQLLPLLVLGLVSIYITNIAEIWGIQHMSSAKACLMYSLSPFVAALLAYLILKETMSSKKWLGLVVGFFGLAPILMDFASPDEFTKDFFIFSWPELSILAAVIASVYGWILLKKIVHEYRFTPILANGFSMLIGGFFALCHSYLSGENWSPFPVIDAQYKAFIECAIWMLIISNIICYNLYGYLLKRFSATFMALAGLVTPLFASVFGWYFLDEKISWHFYASMLIFSAGLFIFYQEELRSRRALIQQDA